MDLGSYCQPAKAAACFSELLQQFVLISSIDWLSVYLIVSVTATGEDAEQALNEICQLFSVKFDEAE